MKFFKSLIAFSLALFKDPRAVGAIAPSSSYLAKSMANCIDRSQVGYILELGPGTGVITKGILNSGVAPDRLIALELAPHFAKKLQTRFPGIAVINGSATQLSELLRDKQPIHTIISSLPLRSMSKKDRDQIFSQVQKVLVTNGQFIQFTYAITSNKRFYPDNFVLQHSFFVWRNIPPARVTVFEIN